MRLRLWWRPPLADLGTVIDSHLRFISRMIDETELCLRYHTRIPLSILTSTKPSCVTAYGNFCILISRQMRLCDRLSSKVHLSHDRRDRALSPLSHSNTAQYFDEHQAIMRNSIRKLLHPNQPSNETLENENVAQDPPSVAAPVRKPKSPPPQMNNKHTPTSPVNHTVKRMPAMPITNESPVHPPVSKVTNGHKKSKSGSVSYSTFPNVSNRPGNNIQTDHTDHSVRSPYTSKTNKRQGMILENSSVPPNLDGVVDLSNTVDTDVITKTLPGTPPPPLPSISEKRPRPVSVMSRTSTRSFSATPGLSPLHSSPHDIELPVSFPPANWPLTPTSITSTDSISKKANANAQY